MKVEQNQIVVPGEVLERKNEIKSGFGTYELGDEIRSKYLGVVRLKNSRVNVVKLSGAYIPKGGDSVIGEIEDVQDSYWIVDIDSPYSGYLSLSEGVEEFVDLSERDLTEFYDVRDVVYIKVKQVTKRKSINLTMQDRMCRKLKGGNIIKISSAKVPRVIGRKGSMIELIKNKTNSHIIVGQNGLVWIKDGRSELVKDAIYKVERESHVEGLTDKVEEMLDKRLEE